MRDLLETEQHTLMALVSGFPLFQQEVADIAVEVVAIRKALIEADPSFSRAMVEVLPLQTGSVAGGSEKIHQRTGRRTRRDFLNMARKAAGTYLLSGNQA
jgi:hypothetical protein